MSITYWDESHVKGMCEAFGLFNVVKI